MTFKTIFRILILTELFGDIHNQTMEASIRRIHHHFPSPRVQKYLILAPCFR